MKKEEETIKTYKELIDIFTKLANQTDNLFLAEKSKEFVADFETQVKKYENQKSENPSTSDEQIEEQPEETEEKKVDTNNPIEKEDDEYFNYINNTIRNDSNLKEQLDRLTNKLVEDLKNPTDELIEVWVRNYKDFVLANYLKEEYMIKYMMGIFEKYDLNRDYVNDVEELYEQIELETPDLDSSKKDNPEETKENPKETKENPEETKENPEETKENPEDKKDNPEESKGNSQPIDTHKKNTSNSGKDNEPEPIRITHVKSAFLNRTEKLGAGVAAIACLSTPIITPAIIVAYMSYRLFKNYRYKNKNLEKFLKDNNFTIDDGYLKVEVIDEQNKPIYKEVTEETVGKEEYAMIKKELMHMGAIESGLIPEEYKQNRFFQILMNLKPVKRLKNVRAEYIKQKEEAEATKDYFERKQKNSDISLMEIFKEKFDLDEEPEEKGIGARGLK